MAVVGAFARVESGQLESVCERLSMRMGVSTFDIPKPGMVGVLIEAADIDHAHSLLVNEVGPEPGVMGVWPVFVSTEDEVAEEGNR